MSNLKVNYDESNKNDYQKEDELDTAPSGSWSPLPARKWFASSSSSDSASSEESSSCESRSRSYSISSDSRSRSVSLSPRLMTAGRSSLDGECYSSTSSLGLDLDNLASPKDSDKSSVSSSSEAGDSDKGNSSLPKPKAKSSRQSSSKADPAEKFGDFDLEEYKLSSSSPNLQSVAEQSHLDIEKKLFAAAKPEIRNSEKGSTRHRSMKSNPKSKAKSEVLGANLLGSSKGNSPQHRRSQSEEVKSKLNTKSSPKVDPTEFGFYDIQPGGNPSSEIDFADDGLKVGSSGSDQVEKPITTKNTITKLKAELPAGYSGFANDNQRYLKMPSFVQIDAQHFDENTYEQSFDSKQVEDEQTREDLIRKLQTTVRWRQVKNKMTGEVFKESNARFVRWSDGSETFHVGAEAFDVVHHPVPEETNQLYVRHENYYQAQSLISEKLTLRPKLESKFGQSHVQAVRNRAFYKPQDGCVKVLMEVGTNPNIDRERKVKAELAQLRKEEREKRRQQRAVQRRPQVKPAMHRTADDNDSEMLSDHDDRENENAISLNDIKRGTGIRTNRNVDVKPAEFEYEYESVEEVEDSEVDQIDFVEQELEYMDAEFTDDELVSDQEPKVVHGMAKKGKDDSDTDMDMLEKLKKRKSKKILSSDSDNN